MAEGGRPRLAVLDDGLFVRTPSAEIRPLSATFNRFVEAVARTGSFGSVRYMVPVRDLRVWEVEPPLDPIDQTLVEVVPTSFFSGIADYVLRAGYLAARNWSRIDGAIADADLVWLRLPASNALLALLAARRRGVAHFGWVAGSVADVATAVPRRALLGLVGRSVGEAYDAVTRLAGETGPLIRLDADLFASVVSDNDIEATRERPAGHRPGGPRIAWAGRMAGEKGLAVLVDALMRLRSEGRDLTLVLMGDGPARGPAESALAALPLDRVEDYGYVGDRAFYMDVLRGADVLVQPSLAEGVPKVVVEAMAAGLAIVASDTGAVREVLGDGARGRLVPAGDRGALSRAVAELIDDDTERRALGERALAWAADHTAEAQARRLVDRLKAEFPGLGWAD